jgi:RHS repeat-associated protein
LPDGTDIETLVDGEGHRVWKRRNGANVQGFLYRSALQPAAELDGSGSVVARFVYGMGRNVPELMIKGGVTYRILTDHLGSPRLVVNTATGAVAQRMEFDEFGRVLVDTSPGFTPFGFAGGLYDRDTRLVRFGARDYDPETGRWTAKDPLGFGGGDANLYGYCGGDPVNYVDVNGRHPVAVAVAAVLTILAMGAAAPSDTADAPADILGMAFAIVGLRGLGAVGGKAVSAGAATCGQEAAAGGGVPSLTKALSGLHPKDAQVVQRAAELARGGQSPLSALAQATGEVIPAGQVHLLGEFQGAQVFGSVVTRTGVVTTSEGSFLVRASLGEAIEVLGTFP